MATLDLIKFPEGLDDCTVLGTAFVGQEKLLVDLKLWSDKAASTWTSTPKSHSFVLPGDAFPGL